MARYYVQVCKVWLSKENELCNGKVKLTGKFHLCQRCGVSYGPDYRLKEFRMRKPGTGKPPKVDVRALHDMEP